MLAFASGPEIIRVSYYTASGLERKRLLNGAKHQLLTNVLTSISTSKLRLCQADMIYVCSYVGFCV